jgi:hypothetical protein
MEQSKDAPSANNLPFRSHEDFKEAQQANEPTLTDPGQTTDNPVDPALQQLIISGEEKDAATSVESAEPNNNKKKKKKKKSKAKSKRGKVMAPPLSTNTLECYLTTCRTNPLVSRNTMLMLL